jgi:hypothetical protein
MVLAKKVNKLRDSLYLVGNKKGVISTVSIVISIIVLIPIVIFVGFIFISGIAGIRTQIQSISGYVSDTQTALYSGTSVIVGTLSPVFSGNQFMAQFYGGPACMTLIDELARTSILTEPNDPSTLSGKFFVCAGTFSNFSSSPNVNEFWDYLPIPPGNAQSILPSWTLDGGYNLTNLIVGEVNGSHGSLSFANYTGRPSSLAKVETQLSTACESFLNSTVYSSSSGTEYNVPSAYISAITCAPLAVQNSQPVFISLRRGNCAANSPECSYNPLLFMHGEPASIQIQTCNYLSGAPSLTCEIEMS